MAQEDYLSIKTENIIPEISLPFTVYKKERKLITLLSSNYIQVFPSGYTLTQEQAENLRSASGGHLFISSGEKNSYSRYLEDNIPTLLDSGGLSFDEHAEIIYLASVNLLGEILLDPLLKDNILRAKNIVANMVSFTAEGIAAYKSLIDATDLHYSTASHSVNVASFTLAIGRQMGIDQSSDLIDLGVGGLLHDIGKSVVNRTILEKKGALSDREWKILKDHPYLGVKLCEESHVLSKESILVVHQHQERCNGTGYPNGLNEKDIHLFSKIVGMADTFDAMTTHKPYKKAISTFDALKRVKSDFSGAYDQESFKRLVMILEENK